MRDEDKVLSGEEDYFCYVGRRMRYVLLSLTKHGSIGSIILAPKVPITLMFALCGLHEV